MATYLYNDIEYKLTGRTALKIKKNRSRKKDADNAPTQKILHEITPLDEKIESTEWVDLDNIFKVISPEETEDD